MGLDRPLVEQYWRFIAQAVQGDFGQSIRAMRPVLPYVLERLPATLELSLGALLLAPDSGSRSGSSPPSSGTRRGTASRSTSPSWPQSAPSFWIGLILIAIFSVKLQVLPVSGREASDT